MYLNRPPREGYFNVLGFSEQHSELVWTLGIRSAAAEVLAIVRPHQRALITAFSMRKIARVFFFVSLNCITLSSTESSSGNRSFVLLFVQSGRYLPVLKVGGRLLSLLVFSNASVHAIF